MMTMLRTFSVVFLVLALSGCTSTGTVDANAAPPADDHTYYVMGLAPANVRIMLFKVDVRDGKFRQDPLPPASFVGTATDGYVVGATHSGNTLGITQVQVVNSPNAIFAKGFVPCSGAPSVVFTAEGGKVVYLGNVHFDVGETNLKPSFDGDIEAARTYLRAHYPNLADKLEQGHFTLMPAAMSCGAQY
jgi:hypothetical protein